jgi:carbonic anhydrase
MKSNPRNFMNEETQQVGLRCDGEKTRWSFQQEFRDLCCRRQRRGESRRAEGVSSNAEFTLSADEALLRLKAGNERFIAGNARFPTVQREIVADLAKGQHPYATILSCSDARVPPELIFDAGFGELFIIRVAGNVMSPEVAGSLQYASRHLCTPLFVVLGHTHCGAVAAAIDTRLRGTRQHSRIQILVDSILPGLAELDPQLSPEVMLAQAVEANVRWSMHQILESPEGRERQGDERVKLVGAIYEIETGGVRFLEMSSAGGAVWQEIARPT